MGAKIRSAALFRLLLGLNRLFPSRRRLAATKHGWRFAIIIDCHNTWVAEDSCERHISCTPLTYTQSMCIKKIEGGDCWAVINGRCNDVSHLLGMLFQLGSMDFRMCPTVIRFDYRAKYCLCYTSILEHLF